METTVFEFVNWDGSVIAHPKVIAYPETVDDLITIMKERGAISGSDPRHRIKSFDHILHRLGQWNGRVHDAPLQPHSRDYRTTRSWCRPVRF